MLHTNRHNVQIVEELQYDILNSSMIYWFIMDVKVDTRQSEGEGERLDLTDDQKRGGGGERDHRPSVF